VVHVNMTHELPVQYSTLAHELGHIFCGHLGMIGSGVKWSGRRPLVHFGWDGHPFKRPLRLHSHPSYNTPPCEAAMPFLIRPFRRLPVTRLLLNTLTKMAKALRMTVAEVVE
jgi:hypothetical protein